MKKLSFFWTPNHFSYLLCNEIGRGLTPWFVCYIGSRGLHSNRQLKCFDVRNLQAITSKSCEIRYRNLWHNIQPSNRPFLVSHWRLKNNLIWKMGLVLNNSRTKHDLHNIFAILNFCFSAIWITNQPMSKKQLFSSFFSNFGQNSIKLDFSTLKVSRKLTFKFKMLFSYNQFNKIFSNM